MQLATTIDAVRRQGIAVGLSHILSDTHGLRLETLDCQRCVDGPMSGALRTLLGELHDELCAAETELAAGVRSHGGAARTASGQRARGGSTDRGETRTVDDLLGRLVDAHESIARSATGTLKLAEAARDEPTRELLARRADVHSKHAWMLAFAAAAFLIARALPGEAGE